MTQYIKPCPLFSFTIIKMDLPTPLESQSKLKKMTNIMRDTIVMLLIGVAYGLFAYMSINAFFEYKEELTGVNQVLVSVKELTMPTITVCSQNVFKNVSNETDTEMVLQNLNDYVYKWEDLFDESKEMKDESLWNNNHEIFSSTLGLCYSLRSDKNATQQPQNFMYFYLFLPVGKRYQV